MKNGLVQLIRMGKSIMVQMCVVTITITVITVNFLNSRTQKIFVVITLKFELCGSVIEL